MLRLFIILTILLLVALPTLAQDDLIPATCGKNGVAASDLAPLYLQTWLNGEDLTLADLQRVYRVGTSVKLHNSPEGFEWPYATRPEAGWGNTNIRDRGNVTRRVIELWRPDGTARTVWIYAAAGEPTLLLWPSDHLKSVGHPPAGCTPVTLSLGR